jgi:hypothetical protein
MPLGIAAVQYGPLKGFNRSLRSHEVLSSDYGSVTLSSLTGVPYWLLALVIAAATLVVSLQIRRSRKARSGNPRPARDARKAALLEAVITRPWKPWQSGIAIGVLGLAAYTSAVASGRSYPLCVTWGVQHFQLLATDSPLEHVWEKRPVAMFASEEPRPAKSVSWWMIAVVAFLVVGSHVSARLRGSFRLLPKPPDETIIAFLGGGLVGGGAALATGCVVGNIMSGVALMSVGNLLFVVVFVLANWATTYFYLMRSTD